MTPITTTTTPPPPPSPPQPPPQSQLPTPTPKDEASDEEDTQSVAEVDKGIGAQSELAVEEANDEAKEEFCAVNSEGKAEQEDAIMTTATEEEEEEELEDSVNPATVFAIRLKQPRSNLLHKMSAPELCPNFSAVARCGKINAIACALETCARIPSSNANPPFWIPIRIVIPERPTECAVFNVRADGADKGFEFSCCIFSQRLFNLLNGRPLLVLMLY